MSRFTCFLIVAAVIGLIFADSPTDQMSLLINLNPDDPAPEDGIRTFNIVPGKIAVVKAGGDGWSELVKDITGPRDYPAAVGISVIRLRLVRPGPKKPEPFFAIEFLIPMGC